MAGDNEVVFKVSTGLEVNEKQVNKEVQKMSKIAEKAAAKVKPVELSFKPKQLRFKAKEFNNPNDTKKVTKVNEALSKLVDHWNKQFEKGFKSSRAFQEETARLYTNFKKETQGQHEIKKSDKYQNVTATIGKSISDYNEELNKLFVKTYKITAKDLERAMDKAHREYQKRVKELGEKKADEKANKLFLKELTRGQGRSKAATPGADTRIGTRQVSWNDVYSGLKDKRDENFLLKYNDRSGTYFGKNSLMKQYGQNKLKYKKRDKDSLKKLNISEVNGRALEELNRTYRKADEKKKHDNKNITRKDKVYRETALERW